MGGRRFPLMMLIAALIVMGATGARGDVESDLLNAADSGDVGAIERLVEEHGAHVNEARDIKGKTPLHLAAEGGHQATCGELLRLDANVNARDKEGRTPLHLAAAKGHTGTMEELLASGADVNARDRRGDTPLHLAADNIYGGGVETLLRQGADPTIRNQSGRTALDVAKRNHRIEAAAALGKTMPQAEVRKAEIAAHRVQMARHQHDAGHSALSWLGFFARVFFTALVLVTVMMVLMTLQARRGRRMRRLEAARQGENEAELIQRIWAGLDKMEQRAENLETILLRPDDAGRGA